MLRPCVLLSPLPPPEGVRKTCVQCLERLVGEWCGADGSEALPGFREFAMKQVRLAGPARPNPTPTPSPQAFPPQRRRPSKLIARGARPACVCALAHLQAHSVELYANPVFAFRARSPTRTPTPTPPRPILGP